jgi:hypothetical protein
MERISVVFFLVEMIVVSAVIVLTRLGYLAPR